MEAENIESLHRCAEGAEGDVRTITPLGAAAIPGVTLQLTSDFDPAVVSLAYSGSVTQIVQADVMPCRSNSVIHFVNRMFQPESLPLHTQFWIEFPDRDAGGSEQDFGDIMVPTRSTASSHLKRNSTLLMSVLIVFGVFFLVLGVFWGRYRVNLRVNALRSTAGSTPHAWRLRRDTSTLQKLREESEVVPIDGPTVCVRHSPLHSRQIFLHVCRD